MTAPIGNALARRVDAVLNTMTTRERQLVREIAVMVNVRTQMRTGHRYQPTPDTEVLRDAISACLHMEDLYPTMSRLERLANRKAARTAATTGSVTR